MQGSVFFLDGRIRIRFFLDGRTRVNSTRIRNLKCKLYICYSESQIRFASEKQTTKKRQFLIYFNNFNFQYIKIKKAPPFFEEESTLCSVTVCPRSLDPLYTLTYCENGSGLFGHAVNIFITADMISFYLFLLSIYIL